MRLSLKQILWSLALVALSVCGAHAQGRKVALVVGNEAYQGFAALTTPVADASAMARSLRGLGFEVTLLTDAGPEVFQAVLETFAHQAETADTALFYYAGHAFQTDGVNYLVPVSATAADAAGLAKQSFALTDVAARLGAGSAQVLLILDAARALPVPGVAAGGLAPVKAGAGGFVAFAAAPGQVAPEGSGANSPFTAALLAHIAVPGQSLSDVMVAVRDEVAAATGGQQVPWDQSALRAPFYFAEEAMPEFEIAAAASVTIGAPEEAAAKSVLSAVSGEGVTRLAALNTQTRSLSTLTGIAPAAPRIAELPPGGQVAAPENLALAVQQELKRIGCYGMGVDGDWGNGSRAAMRTYYQAKKAETGEVEPTESVWRALLAEPEKTCDAPAPVEKKAATKKTTTKKPAAAEPAPAPKKDGVKCKFMVIAVVCS